MKTKIKKPSRLSNFIKFLLVRYMPSSQALAVLEARRLSKFITENYDCNQQLIILDELKDHIIEYRKNQIVNKQLEIQQNKTEEIILQQNLDKLLAG